MRGRVVVVALAKDEPDRRHVGVAKRFFGAILVKAAGCSVIEARGLATKVRDTDVGVIAG